VSKCIHKIYRKGKLILTETLKNKGTDYEGKLGCVPPNECGKQKIKIWEYRRNMGGKYCH